MGCKYHLALDRTQGGQLSRPSRRGAIEAGDVGDNAVLEWLESSRYHCALDVADLGGRTLQQISAELGVTRERVRQVEDRALRRLIQSVPVGVAEFLGLDAADVQERRERTTRGERVSSYRHAVDGSGGPRPARERRIAP